MASSNDNAKPKGFYENDVKRDIPGVKDRHRGNNKQENIIGLYNTDDLTIRSENRRIMSDKSFLLEVPPEKKREIDIKSTLLRLCVNTEFYFLKKYFTQLKFSKEDQFISNSTISHQKGPNYKMAYSRL